MSTKHVYRVESENHQIAIVEVFQGLKPSEAEITGQKWVKPNASEETIIKAAKAQAPFKVTKTKCIGITSGD